MIENSNEEFNKYIEEFKKLELESKKAEFLDQLRDFVASLTVIASSKSIPISFLRNNEILDLNNDVVSDGDFFEAAIVYLENSKNIVGQILEKMI